MQIIHNAKTVHSMAFQTRNYYVSSPSEFIFQSYFFRTLCPSRVCHINPLCVHRSPLPHQGSRKLSSQTHHTSASWGSRHQWMGQDLGGKPVSGECICELTGPPSTPAEWTCFGVFWGRRFRTEASRSLAAREGTGSIWSPMILRRCVRLVECLRCEAQLDLFE